MTSVMRMAYLILAHQDEAQLDALLDALAPPGSPDIAIVHADRRSQLWRDLRTRPADNSGRVRVLTNPVAVRWGHHSQVAAACRLIEAALEEGCDFAHLLSGADWPVVPRETIVAAISQEATPHCFIEAEPGLREDRMQTWRFDARWLRLDPHRDWLAYAATWELRRVSAWLDRFRENINIARSRPWGVWSKGSSWWSLPNHALQLLSVELPRLIASGRLTGTLCSDEHAIQTIIAAHFPDQLAGNRRFIDWSEAQSSPRVLRRADVPAIVSSGAWFARKFDARVDGFFLTPNSFGELNAAAEQPGACPVQMESSGPG